MSTRMLTSIGAITFLFHSALVIAADDAKPLVVELKSFKLPEVMADLFGYNEGDGKLFLYTNGKVTAKVKVPSEGDYEIIVKASGDKALNEGAKFKVAIDGKEVGKETETSDGEPKDYKFTATLKAGERELTIEFTNDVYKEGEYDRNLYIFGVELKKK
ncbi:MAG TPA: carbohydrate-binding domain-containing protein [Gemmataceae bacterium]|nr:carbohydrate-binding domain-containing protein [Gemmataceae bacterium]